MNIRASVRYTIHNLKLSRDSDHPNKLPFSGTLLFLDKASDKPPHGSDGHKILVPRAVAEKRLSTLVGMPLNYGSDLSDHDSQNVVGVVTAAWIEGNKVEVQGYVWKKTFPEAEEDLHGRDLGMSMELADVEIENKDSDVWRLNDFYFTGATALWPESAAYRRTALAAAAAAVLGRGESTMPEDKTKKKAADNKVDQGRVLVESLSASTAEAVGKVMEKALSPVIVSLTTLGEKIEKMAASSIETEEQKLTKELLELTNEVEASGETEVEDDLEAADDTKDKKKKKDEEDQETKDEEDQEDEEMESASEVDIADQNKEAKNKGHKTTVTSGASPKALEAMKGAAQTIRSMSTRISSLEASLDEERRLRKKEKNRLDKIEAQLEKSAQHVARRTVTPELMNLLAKNGVDLNDGESRKLTVQFVDKMFDTCGFQLEPHMKMAFKNQLKAAGVLEQERTM